MTEFSETGETPATVSFVGSGPRIEFSNISSRVLIHRGDKYYRESFLFESIRDYGTRFTAEIQCEQIIQHIQDSLKTGTKK